MSITLPSELARLIEEKIASGMYTTPEEVVKAALAALDEREEADVLHNSAK